MSQPTYTRGTPFEALCVGAAAVVVAMVLGFMLLMWLVPAVGRLGGNGSEIPQPVIIAPVVLCLMGFTIAPPAEEMLYRSVLYNSLRRWMGPVPAVIVQAAVFGAMHPYGLTYMIVAFGVGVLLGAMYLWRRALWSPVLVHGLFNLTSLMPLLVALMISSFTPTLGVMIENVDGGAGCRVTAVSAGTVADQAMIQPGDIITAVDDQPIHRAGDLPAIIRQHGLGDVIELTVVHEGEQRIVQVRLRGPRAHILW